MSFRTRNGHPILDGQDRTSLEYHESPTSNPGGLLCPSTLDPYFDRKFFECRTIRLGYWILLPRTKRYREKFPEEVSRRRVHGDPGTTTVYRAEEKRIISPRVRSNFKDPRLHSSIPVKSDGSTFRQFKKGQLSGDSWTTILK